MFTTKYTKKQGAKPKKVKKFAAGGAVSDDDDYSGGGGFAKSFAKTSKALGGLKKDSWLTKASAPAATNPEGDEKEDL